LSFSLSLPPTLPQFNNLSHNGYFLQIQHMVWGLESKCYTVLWWNIFFFHWACMEICSLTPTKQGHFIPNCIHCNSKKQICCGH
jgi:hypothetical protein